MTQTLTKFINLIREDSDLKSRIKEAPNKDSFIQLTVALGKEHGYEFSELDVREAILQDRSSTSHLSEEELENVAGSLIGMQFSGCHATGSSC